MEEEVKQPRPTRSGPLRKRRSIPSRKRRRRGFKHGFHMVNQDSVRERNEQVRNMENRMIEAMPWLEKSDRPACRAWCELEIIGTMMFTNLTREGILLPTGEARRLVDNFRQLKQSQLMYANALGMTPAARKLLQADKDADLPFLLAQLSKKQAVIAEVVEEHADT
jgi:hypothetical protein